MNCTCSATGDGQTFLLENYYASLRWIIPVLTHIEIVMHMQIKRQLMGLFLCLFVQVCVTHRGYHGLQFFFLAVLFFDLFSLFQKVHCSFLSQVLLQSPMWGESIVSLEPLSNTVYTPELRELSLNTQGKLICFFRYQKTISLPCSLPCQHHPFSLFMYRIYLIDRRQQLLLAWLTLPLNGSIVFCPQQ